MKRPELLLLLLAPMALAGCQTIEAHNPFRHKVPPYQSAQQESPLQVPPGMDQPPTNQALVIPTASSGTTVTTAAPPKAQLSSAAAAGASTILSRLTLSDTPDSVYHRVGLALTRADVGRVTARDATAHTYKVAVDTTVTEKSNGGFFHRLFHHDKTKTITGTVTVHISPDGNKSVVTADGNGAAVAQVMKVLKARLK